MRTTVRGNSPAKAGFELPGRTAVFLAAGTIAVLQTVSGQGVAVTGRAPRESPLARTDLPPPLVHYEDIAAQAGLKFRHVSGEADNKQYILETTGSGVALFDFDTDGLLDIFLVNGRPWNLPKASPAPTSRLFRNLGGLRFEDVTKDSGLIRTGWGQGACVGDYDDDGFEDLFVTHYGPDLLYKNEEGDRFRDVTAEAGLPTAGRRWGTGCAFADYDRDGRLDIVVANYVDLDLDQTPAPGESNFCRYKGLAVLCGPRGLPGESMTLYRNLGKGRFEDVSEASGIGGPSGRYGLGVLTLDSDNDGWTDFYIAADSTPSMLFHNRGDGSFVDVGLLSGTSLNENGQEQAGMGVSSGDFDHDGRLDIVKTNFSDDVPSLYRNDGSGFFTDVSYRAGLGVHTNYLGWGVGFVDVDHDGWKDLFIVNSHVYPSIDSLGSASPFRQKKLVYWNIRNGAFIDMSSSAGPGVGSPSSARGAAFGDLDNDGTLEIVINNLDDRPNLLRNTGRRANWILITLQGTQSNRNGLGSRVTVEAGDAAQVAEVRSGGSYLSHNDTRLHFGLGENDQVKRVSVRWPSGTRETFGPYEANRELVLTEGEGVAEMAKR